ncbi:MAG: Eco57I restriction-modification methylase domain-containing protein, partial [Candidatus Binataceae bacterium]
PEERHRWGQHFTGDDVVDLINAFCIRSADGAVLDPACGSGSFLVRAYYRKRYLQPQKPHLDLLSELFGCDIAVYPAHLSTLNLAAREINDEANYPRIARRDFFDVNPNQTFCSLPDGDGTNEIKLPKLHAVVGNPPYVRQEKLGREAKLKMSQIVAERAPGTKLSGRSDVHCYFWPAAAHFLREDGYFGFLTSSSWLDVEYGFALQRWILQNFRIIAICESETEPWFEDARVKTCVTILQRCGDSTARMKSLVKFVQFKKPLAEIIVEPTDGAMRFGALDVLRQRIEGANDDTENDDLRIITKPQHDLWQEGVRAARLLAGEGAQQQIAGEDEEDHGDEGQDRVFQVGDASTYAGGKWGRYVRAPDFYFQVMRDFGSRFVPLGEIADIRFGVKSGCDAFFMPRDITRSALETFQAKAELKRRYGLDRAPVEEGRIKIVRAGDGSEHPIETEYLRPEVHSLMTIDRPVVRAAELDRVVLMVGEPLAALKGTWVARYLRYGETHAFESSKSKSVPVPKRSTVAARTPWYDLTKLVKPGFALWPMAQQYRHIIAHNPERLVCNHNLFDISAPALSEPEQITLTGVLNSTLTGLFKTFYGRFAGTEGNLKTEVIDVNLLEVPDPHGFRPL